MSKKLSKTINETDSLTTNNQINQFDRNRVTAQNDHFDDTKDEGRTGSNDVDNSKDESYNELDSSQQLDCIKSDMMFCQEKKKSTNSGIK